MNRSRVATTALLFLVIGASTVAQAQGGKGKKADRPAPDPHAQQQQEQKQQQQQQPQEQHQLQQQQHHQLVSQAEQQQRIREQQQRAAQYQQQLDQRVLDVQQQTAQLQQQRRAAQYRAQQEYAAQLLRQQQQLQAARNYSSDPYITTPHTYRYVVSGYTRQTNQYGADVLRQAVNYGYQQGARAGQADRQDNWAPNYQNSAGYRDANYGFTGNYVDQTDYNYYFRQGFRRGYTDGYNSQSQYGTSSNGTTSILGSVLQAILGLQQLR
jgi:hypothetical protein